MIGVAADLGDHAVALGHDDVAGVLGGAALDAGADVRRLGPHERDGLALHVRAHQGAVGVVVLEERDQRRGHRDDLLRRHVHVLDLVGLDEGRARRRAPGTSTRSPTNRPCVVDRRVGLGDDVAVLVVGGEVVRLLVDAHDALVDLPVRRLDEAEPVDPGEARQRADEADVRALRRLDRAHAAVVRRVDVADLEARPAHGTDRRGRAPRGAACG